MPADIFSTLDLRMELVGVAERNAKPRRERLADRRLAAAGDAHHHERGRGRLSAAAQDRVSAGAGSLSPAARQAPELLLPFAVEGDIARRDRLELRALAPMAASGKAWNGTAGLAWCSAWKGMFQARKRTRKAGQRRARVLPEILDERQPGVLGEEIGPEERLPEDRRQHPVDEAPHPSAKATDSAAIAA